MDLQIDDLDIKQDLVDFIKKNINDFQSVYQLKTKFGRRLYEESKKQFSIIMQGSKVSSVENVLLGCLDGAEKKRKFKDYFIENNKSVKQCMFQYVKKNSQGLQKFIFQQILKIKIKNQIQSNSLFSDSQPDLQKITLQLCKQAQWLESPCIYFYPILKLVQFIFCGILYCLTCSKCNLFKISAREKLIKSKKRDPQNYQTQGLINDLIDETSILSFPRCFFIYCSRPKCCSEEQTTRKKLLKQIG